MAAMVLTVGRAPTAGQLISKLISSVSVFTLPYSVANKDSSTADETDVMIIPDAREKEPKGDGGKGSSEFWEDSDRLHDRLDIEIRAEGEVVIVSSNGQEQSSANLSEIHAKEKFDGILSILVPAGDNEHGD